MGTEKKSKDKSKRKSYSSASENEGKSKRHRSSEEHAGKSRKREKKEKSQHGKSDKLSKRHSSKEKESEKKLKSRHSKHHSQLKADFMELSKDDYFAKNNEFATWLKEKRKTFFSDLSSESAHQLFSEFIEDWNSHVLDSKYYAGISSGPRSAHKWKIKY